ncbi:hypothetical protein L596_012832 [Steinernema carpocapsae]|uniref:C3H1-type domain-containing protein n=2 Tax=Steinernema carpocapsae TaxID=34508 RepID=A0A4U5NYL3_STECR|nr:hypothetical protein L596_012832 [Steinernema carpocapsae]
MQTSASHFVLIVLTLTMSSSGFDSSALDRVNYSQLLAEYTQELQNQHSVNPASSSMMSYKTKMCKAMLDKGECPFKDLCTFAHTNEELRIAVPIPVGILRAFVWDQTNPVAI